MTTEGLSLSAISANDPGVDGIEVRATGGGAGEVSASEGFIQCQADGIAKPTAKQEAAMMVRVFALICLVCQYCCNLVSILVSPS